MLNLKIVIGTPFTAMNNGWVYRCVNLLEGLMQHFFLSVFIPGSGKFLKRYLPDATVFDFVQAKAMPRKFSLPDLIRSYIFPRNTQVFLPGFRYFPGYEPFILNTAVNNDISLYMGLDSLVYYGQNDAASLIFCDFCDSNARSLHNQIKQKVRNPVSGFADMAYLKRIKRTFVDRKIKLMGITDSDCEFIKKMLPQNTVMTVSNGIKIPEIQVDIRSKFESGYLIFVGALSYLPNIDSINFIVKKIWPEVSLKFNNLKLLIVGRDPGSEIVALGKNDPRISVHANVEDVFPFIRMSKIFLCPMFLGGGLKNKILEALVSYTPVLTNREGATGISFINKKHGWIAETKEGMIQGITEMLTMDYERYSLIARNCFELAGRYSWNSVTERLKETIISHWRDLNRTSPVNG